MTLLLITSISMVLAVIMSVVAWRSSREERRRSEARIAVLAAEIHDEPVISAAAVRSSGELFAGQVSARKGFRFAVVAAGGLFVCGVAAALAVVTSSASTGTSTRASVGVERGTDHADSPIAAPIELVALGYEREGDHLTIRGVVRNPSTGAVLERVTAVVLLFREDGGFLTSGRATVESSALGPGGETTFAVTVPGANGVGRYRVSFRTDERVVPHIDRRSRT
jgi:hypothetical protein